MTKQHQNMFLTLLVTSCRFLSPLYTSWRLLVRPMPVQSTVYNNQTWPISTLYYNRPLIITCTFVLFDSERESKHSFVIRGLRAVVNSWHWAWENRTYPSTWVGLGSPLAACSVYGDLTCCVHPVKNLCLFTYWLFLLVWWYFNLGMMICLAL